MSGRKFRIIFAVFISTVIIGSVFFLTLASNPDLTVSSQTVSASNSGSSGLNLILRTSANNTTQGANICISLKVYNPGFLTLNANSSSTAWEKYKLEGFSAGPCGFKPFGILIAQGNYSSSELEFISPLQFYEPGPYMCPLIPNVNQYDFSPHSSNARMYYNSVKSLPGQDTTSFNFQLNISGYWTGNSVSNAAFHTFSPGVYTIFGSDGWNQISVLHFLVK
jgi:hypothetical protein